MLLELAGKEDRDMHLDAFHRKHLRRFFLFSAQPECPDGHGRLSDDDPRGGKGVN